MRSDCWSTSREIKRVLQSDSTVSAGGAVLYCQNGRHWKYTAEGHAIFLGVSGSGKTRRGTIPMVRSFIDAKESFVVVDPKGDLYRTNAVYLGDEYKVHVIDFRHVYESECCNPLAAPAELYRSGDSVKKQVALEMIDDLAHTLYPVAEKSDPFWPESARSVFIGTVYALMEYADLDEITMQSAYQFIAKGEERFGGPNNTYLKEFVDNLPMDSIASMLLQSYVSTASDTRAGIRSTYLEGLSMFARSEGLVSMLGSDDLCINQLQGEQPTAIFIILPDETPIYDKLCTVLISQLMGHYIRLAQDKYDGRLPRRVNFLVEEAGNVGRIGSLGHLMSAGRSRNVRVQLVLQNYTQLDKLYGEAEATTIRSNADVLVAFRTNHWDTLSELSNKCGERQLERRGYSSQEKLISPSQLAAMKTGQALVMISGATKFISWIPDYTKIFDYSEWKAPKHVTRRDRKHSTVFAIDQFVKEMKKRKMDEMMSSMQPERPLPFSSGVITSVAEDKETDSSFNVEDLISKIDAKIAELEELEKEEQRAQEKERQGHGTNKFEIVLVGTTGTKSTLIKAVRDYTSVSSLKKAKEIVDNLPHTFSFDSKDKADKAKRELLEVGGVIRKQDDKDTKDDAIEELYGVVIISDNGNKIKTIKALYDTMGIPLKEAKDCVEKLPHPLDFKTEGMAKKVAKALKAAGAQVHTFGFEIE